jgi:hypothetical protein
MAALAVALGAATYPVMADDTGLAILHDLRREGGRSCFLDHVHYGNSSGASSRKTAEIEAVSSWSGFVDLEYGSDWARFSRAAGKAVKCEQTGGAWGCAIEARPCK